MTMEHLGRSFEVSLLILHPSAEPAEITRSLQLTPSRQKTSGPPRRPPYDQSFWAHRFDCGQVRDLVPFLEQVAIGLEDRREYFRFLTESGGTVELFCGIKVDFNWDEVIPASLMASLASLGIDLRLDAYPQTKPIA